MANQRYFIQYTLMPVEEDYQNEFKGHRGISEEQIPPSAIERDTGRRSRAPISRTINAFLNTGHGGNVYLGVLDNGMVSGMELTQYQKDHIVANLHDVMSRYKPPVERHRYTINFYPVLQASLGEDKREAILAQYKAEAKRVDPRSRLRPHMVQTYRHCWCDNEAIAQINCGKIPGTYIVVIKVLPWNPSDPRNEHPVGQFQMNPIHQNEIGRIYLRRQASLVQYSTQEVAALVRQRVQDHYAEELTCLQRELKILKIKQNSQKEEQLQGNRTQETLFT